MDFICGYKVISQVAIKPSYTTDGVVTYGTQVGLECLMKSMSETASIPSPRRRALSHSGCGCCGNIFAEGVGRHGNNRDSGAPPLFPTRPPSVSGGPPGSGSRSRGGEGEDLNMSTAICPFSAQLTDNPCVLRSSSAISRFSSLSSASRTLYPWCRTVFEYLRWGRDFVRQ